MLISDEKGGYVWVNKDGTSNSQRHEGLEVQCSFIGPAANDYAAIVRDGFQIQQNLEGLRSANMGFVEVGPAHSIPDLVNERWINRVEQSLYLRREIQRVYPVLTLLSALGTITAIGSDKTIESWLVPAET